MLNPAMKIQENNYHVCVKVVKMMRICVSGVTLVVLSANFVLDAFVLRKRSMLLDVDAACAYYNIWYAIVSTQNNDSLQLKYVTSKSSYT